MKDLSLEVQSGELMVFIGPSGCGKTTTLRMINRLEEPTSGSISVDGREIHSYNPIQLRRGIGYAIQQTGLLPHMTVEQNIELVPKLLKWDEKRRHERTRELLEMVGMDYATFAHRYPRQLSGGQQQRVGVLRALATDSPVILMDEPFGALDPISREVLQTELKRIQAQLHKTIVFVTHDMDEAMRLGDRIGIFREGELHQVGTPDELVRMPKDDFVAKFIGRFSAPQKASVDSVRQFMQTVDVRIQREFPGGGRIVQIADAPLWFWVDDEGVLRGVAGEVPESADQWNSMTWMNGDTVCVKETDEPDKVFGRLADGEAEALPVVDEGHRLVGVVTRRNKYGSQILLALGQHVYLVGVALVLGIIVAIPLGILLTRFSRWAAPIIAVVSIIQTIPSLVFFALLIPFIGIGARPALLVLFLYSLLPILRNTYIALRSVDPALSHRVCVRTGAPSRHTTRPQGGGGDGSSQARR